MVEPARSDHAEEGFLDLRAGPGDRSLEGVELAVDGRGSFRFERAARDHALAVGRHRLLAGHEEQRPQAVHVLVEFSELVALAGAMPRGRKLTRLERARLDAGQMISVIGDVARLPELAVADAVDADLDLLAHGVGDGLLDLPVVDGLPAENSGRQVLAAGRDRQPAGVRRDDGLRAVPHVRFSSPNARHE